ncbi:hypothetical protein AB6A40_006733 [Gnathostoma spinigerum]|uniref:Uncharacterized protein n=1 Tax=Gnathostoma spinigerum TaxID=75299 RepID=A0ABD6EJ80_9BILA
MLDLVRPVSAIYVKLSDLKRDAAVAKIFIETFVNWIDYYNRECSKSENFGAPQKTNDPSDWDMYCEAEIELLMRETTEPWSNVESSLVDVD